MQVLLFSAPDLNSLDELQPEDWTDIRPVYYFYVNAGFCHPIKVVTGGKMVGIGAAILHGNTAWLGHIITHPNFRNKGIGKLITESLVNFSFSKGCETINLIATDLGEPVYQKAGFISETTYLFFTDLKPNPDWHTSEKIFPISEAYFAQLIHLDKQVSAEERGFHLQQFREGGYVFLDRKVVTGFYLPSFGDGAIIASTEEAGLELLKFRLQAKDRAAFPAENTHALNFLERLGFKPEKSAKRMRLGKEKSWNRAQIYNRIGGNLG